MPSWEQANWSLNRICTVKSSWISGLRLGLKADVVIHGITQLLFAAQIPFGRLDADVAEQKLNLFEFSPGWMTYARMSGEGRAAQCWQVRSKQKLV